MTKPSIVEVISRYVDLRRSGRELSGLCPFHAEKTPSFTVNEEKSVWYCFSCAEGGDLITFIQKIEGVDFKDALAHLGLTDQPKITREKIRKLQTVKRASKNLRAWALALSERIGTWMRESGDRAYVARKILKELPEADEPLLQAIIERAAREWEILSTLEEDLLDPKQTAALWEQREAIERLVGNDEPERTDDLEAAFPPLSGEYRWQLAGYVQGEA